MSSRRVKNTYFILTFFNTMSASFIWGVNTLFLLDAGLSNAQAFTVNATFTAGMMLFEIPTGVVADTLGRRISFLMGTVTLLFATLIYYYLWQAKGHFILWILGSMIIGLGFTFFSGAVEAWLVDALNATGFKGSLDDVFAKGQIAYGVAMLTGATGGGFIAQYWDLGAPYLFRIGALCVSFTFAFFAMRDLGFESKKLENVHEVAIGILKDSLNIGFSEKKIRWMILSAPFIFGPGFYAFYAAQPYLLELYGKDDAYSIAGLAASLVAGSQILGGILVPYFRRVFKKRTTLLITLMTISVLSLSLIMFCESFWWVLILLAVWGLVAAAETPVRQAYLNNCIPSKQRATLLSFDGLMGSSGGVVFQPALGRSADIFGYGISLFFAGLLQLLSIPFFLLAKKEKAEADNI